MVEFMAPWCPACRAFSATWDNFAKKWSRDLDIQVGVIDVTENPGLSGRFLVTALPSIYHVKDGIFRHYRGARTENDLITFVDDKKWKEVDPVSSWTAPDTIQMTVVGLFFKGAMKIRAFYTVMTEEYGIPEWGCYVIFAVITIIAGLLLGLLLVCLCDYVLPSKQVPPPIPKELMEPDKDQEGDIIDDTPENGDADGDQTVRRRKHTDGDNQPSSEETQGDSDKEDNSPTDTKKTK